MTSRALIKAARCNSCRHELLQSILAVHGVSLPHNVLPSRPASTAKARTFSLGRLLSSDNVPRNNSDEQFKLLDANDSQPERRTLPSMPHHIPWYLQEVAPPSTGPHPLSEQTTPDLPENAPSILAPVVEYVFKDLGLDDLKIIDLRGLETPSALGANVIMIIGTTRSVKHLNVSADRLCRWLRSTWKLTPYADGLLGRNELKIKLRRKARRARIASRAGAIFDDKDDGITTGWICVNAGLVQNAPVSDGPKSPDFEGFGDVSGGSRIVVQIFTEQKRAEVDLEGLWAGMLERVERQTLRSLELQSEPSHEQESSPVTAYSSSPNVSKFSVNVAFGQKRSLHSFRHIAFPLAENAASGVSTNPAEASLPGNPPDGLLNDRNSKFNSSFLFQYLESLPVDKAREELGAGPDDRESTLFLRLFYNQLYSLSNEAAALAKFKHLMFGVSLQHPAFIKESLYDSFMDYVTCGYHLDAEIGSALVRAFLTGLPVLDSSTGSRMRLSQSDIELALRALEHLSLRGVDILSLQILTLLYETIACTSWDGQPTDLANDALSTTDAAQHPLLRRISSIFQGVNPSFTPDHAPTLMKLFFYNQDYGAFWRIWRKMPLMGYQRTVADYELLFKLHADLRSVRMARECLFMWAPMMKRENPPVALHGELARHVMVCILLVEPDIESKIKNMRPSDEDSIENELDESNDRNRVAPQLEGLWAECMQSFQASHT